MPFTVERRRGSSSSSSSSSSAAAAAPAAAASFSSRSGRGKKRPPQRPRGKGSHHGIPREYSEFWKGQVKDSTSKYALDRPKADFKIRPRSARPGPRANDTPLLQKTAASAKRAAAISTARVERVRAVPRPKSAGSRCYTASELMRAGNASIQAGGIASEADMGQLQRRRPQSATSSSQRPAAVVAATPAPPGGVVIHGGFLRKGGGATASHPEARRNISTSFQTTCDGQKGTNQTGSVDTVRRTGRHGTTRSLPLDAVDSLRVSCSTPYPAWGGRVNYPHRDLADDKPLIKDAKLVGAQRWVRYGKPARQRTKSGSGGKSSSSGQQGGILRTNITITGGPGIGSRGSGSGPANMGGDRGEFLNEGELPPEVTEPLLV